MSPRRSEPASDLDDTRAEKLRSIDLRAWDELYINARDAPLWHSLPFLRDILDRFRTDGVYKLLDCGCGDGGQALSVPEDFLLVGVDQSANAIQRAQEHLTRAGRRNQILVRAQLEDMPFPEEAFDGAILIDVLTSFPSPVRTLQAIGRHLRADASFLVTTFLRPTGTDGFSDKSEGPAWRLYRDRFFERYCDLPELEAVLESAGFRIEEREVRTDPEAPHPGYRDAWHEHERAVLLTRRC